jgi:hypothetical protein
LMTPSDAHSKGFLLRVVVVGCNLQRIAAAHGVSEKKS